MSDLKKVSKVIELGGDVQKLEKEVKSLESKKTALINEMDEMKKNANKSVLEDRKLVAKDRHDFESEKAAGNNAFLKREQEIKKREKQVEKKEQDLVDLEQRIASHNSKVLAFQKEKKDVEAVKKESLEKQHLAELKIKEFEDKIAEQKGK